MVFEAVGLSRRCPSYFIAMFAKTAELEKAFHALLPVRRLTASPPEELLEAARAWSEEVWQAACLSGPWPLSPQHLSQGLSLVQQMVSRHDGEVSAFSTGEAGKGAEFVVHLPLIEPPA